MKSSLIRTIIAFLLLLVPSGRFASAQPFAQPPIQADVLSRNVPADGEDRSAYSCDVKSRPYVWFDEQRNRAVAFRMYYPAVPKSRCPIILFSHGLGGSSSSCSYLGTRWAQAGCVSIHLRHVGSDESVWKGKLRIFRELRLAYARSWSGRDQAEDMRFVLDRLESLTASDPVLTTLLNLDRS